MEKNNMGSPENRSREMPESGHTFSIHFLGSMSMDRLYSQTMQPWVMAEIRRARNSVQDVILEVVEDTVRVTRQEPGQDKELLLFEHHLKDVTRFAKLHQDPKCFAYLTRDQQGTTCLSCHVYTADSESQIAQIFQVFRASFKCIINKTGQTTGQPWVDSSNQVTDGGDSKSLLFEVKFVGRVKVDSKKVTSDDVDALAEKISTKLETREQVLADAPVNDCENVIQNSANPSLIGTAESQPDDGQLVGVHMDTQSDSSSSQDNLSKSTEQNLSHHKVRSGQAQLEMYSSASTGDASGSCELSQGEDGSPPECQLSVQEPSRSIQLHDNGVCLDRASSVDRKCESGQVMVMQVGQQEITLISLDRKMAILECKFKDISSVSQGSQQQDLFGIVTRKSESNFSCLILRCLSGLVVTEIMNTLQMAFTTAYSQRTAAVTTAQYQVCTTCPLHQLHRICQEVNTMPSQAAYHLLVKKVQHLPDRDLNELNSHMQAEKPESFEESVEVMMIFLHRLCERQQQEHVHISESNKSYKSGMNVLEEKDQLFESLKKKAKRSFITSSLENLLNRGKNRESRNRSVSWTTDSDTNSLTSGDSSCTSTPDMSPMTKEFQHSYPSPPSSPVRTRKRSATLDSVSSSSHASPGLTRRRDVNHNTTGKSDMQAAVNISQQSESQSPSSIVSSTQKDTILFASYRRPSSSWRKAIFNRLCTPQSSADYEDEDNLTDKLPNSSTEIRSMWKKAILETLLLIRLEKEDHNIADFKTRRGECTLSDKLEYQELTPCLKEITAVWDKMLSLQNSELQKDIEDGDDFMLEEEKKVPRAKLLDYVKKGVPRNLRGQIWLFLIQQQLMDGATSYSPWSNASYEGLLRQLTTHQHAILIDLGRTFPSHPYFKTSLGPGQLELFNLLKAYSLLDTEVGYCQGLSFIVGTLLMHMKEISVFHVFKYMMYELGLRKQFKPSMTVLQMKLYQLTRLLHDHYKDVYDHLESHEISSTLYAAPWFLTLFASQFPLGFVARVFDMVFVQGIDALFKVALMLIGNHRALILQCDTFEAIVDFLKITLPEMVQVQMERIINQAFELDIDKELQSYEVEYHVLSEEMKFYPLQPHLPQHLQHHLPQHLQHSHPNRDYNRHDKGQSPSASMATMERPYRKFDKTRMSIDLEMLYRLEHDNSSLRNQNAELVEKLQQEQSQRDSCEQSVVAGQVERDKLRSQILALELERAALLMAVTKLQKLIPLNNQQHLNISRPAALPTSHSLPALDTVSDLSQATTCFTTTNDIPLEDASRDSVTSVSDGGESSNKIPVGLNSSKNIPVTSCGHTELVTSQAVHEHDSRTVTESGLSSCTITVSSSLTPDAADLTTRQCDIDEQTTKSLTGADQHFSQTDLHTFTTVSSTRQAYLSRSISNVVTRYPTGDSPASEDRHKSVKVMVQRSPTSSI